MIDMIRNIAIYYPSLENFGGIENVILGQLRIFEKTEINVILITDTPVLRLKDHITVKCEVIDSNQDRESEWARIIQSNKIEAILINGASFLTTRHDIEQIHANKAKVILTIHFSFPSPIIFTEAWECYEANYNIGLMCDAVVTVSDVDRIWWAALGLNAYYIQNPFYVSIAKKREYPKNTVIWVGRDTLQKQPWEALKIIKEVKYSIPDVKLLVIGPELTKKTSKLLLQLDITDNVEYHPNEKEVSSFYNRANVYLLTSITESFCLTLAESKAHGLPAIMYELPFLELTRSDKGIIAVKQGDVKSAADAIVKLLTNQTLCHQMGVEAEESLSGFNDEQVLIGWKNLFYELESGKQIASASIKTPDQIIINQIFEAWKFQRQQNQYKIDFFEDYNKILSGKNLQSCFNKMLTPIKSITKLVRKLKAYLR